jgi:hypothetical protein
MQPALNVLTTAVVRSRRPSRPWRYRTSRLTPIIDGELSSGILEDEVAADVGIPALGFEEILALPNELHDARVHAPEEWTPPRFLGARGPFEAELASQLP